MLQAFGDIFVLVGVLYWVGINWERAGSLLRVSCGQGCQRMESDDR